jgi:fumarate reductase flavoprotein subunit
MKKLETDIVVVGGGTTGLTAALTAAELGARVVLFEKMPEAGGRTHGGNGPFAAGTKMQRDRQIPLTAANAFQIMMDHTHWMTDARLVANYVNRSSEIIEWLQSLGIIFSDVVSYYPGAEYTWHFRERDTPEIAGTMLEKAKKLGVQAFLETPVQTILKDGERVTGVVAKDKSGEAIEVSAKSVIVCTGGFGGNKEWIKKHTGFELHGDLFSFAFPELTGDGLRMAWEAGAAQTQVVMDIFVSLPEPYWGPGGTAWELGSFRQPNLAVNIEGERFMNEETMKNPAFAGNAIHRQTGGCAFMIFDETANEYYDREGWDIVMSRLPVTKSENMCAFVQKAEAEGYKNLFTADSLEELSAKTGIHLENLRQTVAEYNSSCESGRDPLFHKDAKYLKPVKRPKFYAAKFYVGAYGTLGGIKIDYKTQVLDTNNRAIPGFYAAGKDANSIYGDTYIFALSGNDSAFEFYTGRVAAEQAVKYLQAGDPR